MEPGTSPVRVELSTGLTASYVAAGPADGRPVVLLHAWAESCRSFDRLLPLLPRTVRALAPDQRGHGDSDRPEHGYDVVDLAADVVAFLDALGLSSAVLLGSSSGGYVAQQVAITRPDRVDGLVLVASPATLHGRPPFVDDVERLTDPVDAAWVRQFVTGFPHFQPVPESYLEDRVADGARLPAEVWRKSLDGLRRAVPPLDQATITVPTLILSGERDELLGPQQQQDLHRAVPGSHVVVYEQTGHLVLWEQPARIAADLTNFLESLSQGPD